MSSAVFDLLGELPKGTTVLEASAGTGKTYAIVGLATRFVAEGVVDVSQLLLVTFSRAATQELRERTRERFSDVARGLADDAGTQSTDELVRHLGAAEPGEVLARRERLLRALSDFDAGTIATTHSFCQRMLDGLGIAGEREPDTRFVEEVTDLTGEVVDDLFLREYAHLQDKPPISRAEAFEVSVAAIGDSRAALAPDADAPGAAGYRVRFAHAARGEVERRKRATGLRDFDDQLALLHGVLADPVHGAAACARVRERYRVVLVDEFQDTDPLQWGILRRAFHGMSTLVLVGDPKQAIYAFRGAEVLSYLDAVRLADTRHELRTNRRADAGLIGALDHVYGGAALGHPGIVVSPVLAQHDDRMPQRPAMRLRRLTRGGSGPLNAKGFPVLSRLRGRVADDLANDIVALLTDPPSLRLGPSPRPVAPGDIAVLVRTRTQQAIVQAALNRAGVPSVLAGGSSVFATPAATQWMWVLQAMEQPHRGALVRLAALTPLLGWTAATMDAVGADAVGAVAARMRDYAQLFAAAGFAAVFERLSTHTDLAARLLGIEGGERQLTDLRHIAQLLDKAVTEDGLGLTALTRWLADRIDDPAATGVRERSRRLDSDAAAVQLATVHASKGLEFPIVYVPYGWDTGRNPFPSTLLLHDPDGTRVLDVGGKDADGYRERRKRYDAEEAGEELRLLYVALSRAMCQVVAWWAPSASTGESPLHRLLFGRSSGGVEVPVRTAVPADEVVAERLAQWALDVSGDVVVEPVGEQEIDQATWTPVRHGGDGLVAARFERVLDMQWRRTSYSALTAGSHARAGVGSEVDEPGRTDEPEEAPPTDDATDALPTDEPLSVPASPMNALPSGAAFGTLVHEILESMDTSAADLDAELLLRSREHVAVHAADVDPAALARALGVVVRTPVPTPSGPLTLADIPPADRLAELEFEFPLARGDEPGGAMVDESRGGARLHDIAQLLRHHLRPQDPLTGYADRLDDLDAPPLRGYLTGSIDAVVRTRGESYLVVDYKTNRLAEGELSVAHYTRERMAAEMIRADYPLQALLYSVALHRYLRWRMPHYRPERHLGGVRYLFVRGMAGPDTPPGHGVFDWDPPAVLVVALSDLLAS